jgi:hypothetical protein
MNGGGRKWTIAIRPTVGQAARKVTKIIGLRGEGFSMLTPYHTTQSGYLCKMPVDPKAEGTYQGRWEDMIGYTVEKRVKLTYHVDGFVQFSSISRGDIISGRDAETGQPKGLGLFTHPLSSPIFSGPSVGVTLWGLQDFVELETSNNNALIFEPHHFFYRACSPDTANGWIVSVYVFPSGVVPPCRLEGGHYLLDVAIEPLNFPLLSVMRLSLIHLLEEKVFLGIAISRAIVSFPSPSGWTMNGPGDFTRDRKGHVLVGFYPRTAIPVQGLPVLDRKP